MRADGTLHRGFGDRLGARIAETEEHFLGALRFVLGEQAERVFEGLDAEITVLTGALHTVEESGEVDELRTRVHEAEIDQIDVGWWSPIRHEAG